MRLLVGLVVATFVVVACGSDSEEPNTFVVTYDGSDCSYSGPESLTAGSVNLTYVNDSEDDVGVSFRQLNAGFTWDDFVNSTDANYDTVSSDIIWINRAFRGLENRGEIEETVGVAEGAVAIRCVKFAPNDGPPTDFYNVRSIEVTG